MSLISKRLDETDIPAMFDIELADEAPFSPVSMMASVTCPKCNGSKKFRNRSGRIVGDCFACEGTGISKAAGKVKGNCLKCDGFGEWRPGYQCFACKGTGNIEASAPAVGAEIDVSAIATAFASAMSAGIQHPRLALDTFTFSRAPDHGKNAGSIYVKEGEQYLGKVTAGKFFPVQACDDPTKDRIVKVASDPHNAAKAYGFKTGKCSCCKRTLTNGESINLGIGPICREKFGWG